MMKLLTTTLARIFFALPMAVFGIFHLIDANAMVGMVPAWIPGAVFFVYLTGLALIAAAVSIIWNKKARLASLLLALMLLIFVLTIHLPAGEAGMPMLLKDFGLMGGALMFAGIAKD